jgi:hypothetical protein
MRGKTEVGDYDIAITDINRDYTIVVGVSVGDGGYGTHKLLRALEDAYNAAASEILECERKGWVYL